jgi:transcriptional regulator with XRE-family HTH domain
MPTRRRSRVPKDPTPSLTVHQIVAYNFTRARQLAGWTQSETSERLEPFLGYRLNQAGVSAIERTFDSDRRRNIDVAEIVAFSRCFGVPLGWFFIPPTAHATDLIEPVQTKPDTENMVVADLIALIVGTPEGWQVFVDEVAGRLEWERRPLLTALHYAFRGDHDEQGWEQQIDLRRRALLSTTLARQASPGEEMITRMAALLVDLVKLTPLGFNTLREMNPQEALELLARGDHDVQTAVAYAEQRRAAGERSEGEWDELRPIDPAEALGLTDEPAARET